jgi:hypothetical protein
MIPFLEDMIEPWLRKKYPKVDAWFVASGEALKKNLKLIALICLFVGCYRAWVFEHRNAQTAMYGKDGKSEAWAKYNECDKQRAVDDTLTKSCSSNLTYQQSRNDGQQDLFNRCMLALGLKAAPEPRKIDVYRWKFPATYTYPNQGQVQFWVLVAVADRATTAKGNLKCDAPFKALTSSLLTHGNAMRADYEQTDSKTLHVEFAYPPWSATNPLVFDVFTPAGQEINSCSFELD